MTDSNISAKKPPINWIPASMFIINTLGVLIAVPWYGITHGFSTSAWVACIMLNFFCGMAITGGYHRLWSHNAYDAHPILKVWYALWGACAAQNSILVWASGHRVHHRHVDDIDLDPYSAKRGLWFSHMGWMLRHYPSGKTNFDNVKNLQADPIVMWQHKHYTAIALSMMIGVPVLLGILSGDFWGMILIAGFLRMFISHHVTFFINSIAHKWGTQPYTDENTARDNAFFAFLTHGEGYHNYHHIFQADYRNGIRWYHWDPTKWLIAAMSWVGLTSNLKTVSNVKIQRAMIDMHFKKANAQLEKVSSIDDLAAHVAQNVEQWKGQLEKEYEDFKEMLHQWADLQSEKMQVTRKSLQTKWDNTAFHARYKELEISLQLQNKRLQSMREQFAFA
jgi:stearoyl-CoA desaturase (delta-9 desaturase)